MVPEMEKPIITEIKVMMDCNGCVQKIKKALHGITGIYDIYVDFPQQKLTIVGWADPEKIVKAIKKTRKTAVICSHTEQSDHQPTTEPSPEVSPPPEGGAPPPPAPESTTPQPEEPRTEAALPQKEPPKNQPPPPDNPPPESKPQYDQSANNEPSSQSTQHITPKDHEEIHVIYHHPPEYGHRYTYGPYHNHGGSGAASYPGAGPGFRDMPPQPVYVTHRYNTYNPSPYVTEYTYPYSPPGYSYYGRPDQYIQVYYSGSNGNGNGSDNGNIMSIFSEENPNACTIV